MARRRQLDAQAAPPQPSSKRLKTTETTHVPTRSGLDFLVDEDARKERKLGAKLTNGVPSSKTTRVDESRAVVASDTKDQRGGSSGGSSPDEAIEISSGEEESDDEGDEEDETEQRTAKVSLPNGPITKQDGVHDEVSEDAVAGAEDVDMDDPNQDEPEEPSFGDMLQARHPDPIDVQASFPNPMADRQALIPTSAHTALSAPSGTSLGTVLTQALRTNDKDLLESCFNTRDLPSIRATIERLPSQHVATLLQRLAERIHRRPGRTGSLLVWVQWSLIAHGGYLATQPDLMRKLKSLSLVIRERANGLQPLLHLKGKLDMLSAQLDLRKRIQSASRAANASDEEDEGVIYVEGRDDEEWSDSDGADEEAVPSGARRIEPPIAKPTGQVATPNSDMSDSESASESDDDMPNGVVQEGKDVTSSEDEEEGVLDLEAEETSDDEGVAEEEEDSDEDGESDIESEDEPEPSDDESEDEGVKPPAPKTLSRKR